MRAAVRMFGTLIRIVLREPRDHLAASWRLALIVPENPARRRLRATAASGHVVQNGIDMLSELPADPWGLGQFLGACCLNLFVPTKMPEQ